MQFSSAFQDLKNMNQEAKVLENQFRMTKNNEYSDNLNFELEKRLDLDDDEEVIDTNTRHKSLEKENNNVNTNIDQLKEAIEEAKRDIDDLENSSEKSQSLKASPEKLSESHQAPIVEIEDPVATNEISEDEIIDEPVYKAPNPIHQLSELNIEIERINMEQEDRLSRNYELAVNKVRFAQKDVMIPQEILSILYLQLSSH